MCIAQGWYRRQRARYGLPNLWHDGSQQELCVLKWRPPVLKTRNPCSWKLCGKNKVLDSQESVELWSITPKTMISSPYPLSVHAVYTMNVPYNILYVLNFMDPSGFHKIFKLRPNSHSSWCGHHVSLEVNCHFGHVCTGLKCLCSPVIQKSDGANSCVVTRYLSTVKRSNFDRCGIKIISGFKRFLGWLHYLICCINDSHLSTL